jgi:hypothetical protein
VSETSEVENGKEIVGAILLEVARQLGLTLSEVEWFRGTDDFDHGRLTLAFLAPDRTRHLLKFSIENLEDAPADNHVQASLRAQVNQALADLVPPPRRIGF